MSLLLRFRTALIAILTVAFLAALWPAADSRTCGFSAGCNAVPVADDDRPFQHSFAGHTNTHVKSEFGSGRSGESAGTEVLGKAPLPAILIWALAGPSTDFPRRVRSASVAFLPHKTGPPSPSV